MVYGKSLMNLTLRSFKTAIRIGFHGERKNLIHMGALHLVGRERPPRGCWSLAPEGPTHLGRGQLKPRPEQVHALIHRSDTHTAGPCSPDPQVNNLPGLGLIC